MTHFSVDNAETFRPIDFQLILTTKILMFGDFVESTNSSQLMKPDVLLLETRRTIQGCKNSASAVEMLATVLS